MKWLAFLFLLPSLAFADPLELTVREVKDADTIGISVLLPPPLNELDVRVNGIDTPEMPAKSYRETGKLNRAGCVAEAELALRATAYVNELIDAANGKISIDNYDWGKYGGRLVADVYIEGKLLADMLLQRGYAVPYFGVGERHEWCHQ